MHGLRLTSLVLTAVSVSTLSAQVQPRQSFHAYHPQQTLDRRLTSAGAVDWNVGSPSFLLQQRQPGEKSPALAGILSFFLPFGTGSFYAGHDGHGIRHLVFGGVTLVGTIAGLAVACDDGFDLCDEDSPGYAVAAIFAVGHLVNVIWGTVTAVGDANAYNRQLRENALQIAPALMLVETNAPQVVAVAPAQMQRVGVRVVRVVF